jgi:hypothetical protein
MIPREDTITEGTHTIIHIFVILIYIRRTGGLLDMTSMRLSMMSMILVRVGPMEQVMGFTKKAEIRTVMAPGKFVTDGLDLDDSRVDEKG